MRYQSDLGKVLDRLHFHISMMKRVGIRDHSMIRHKNGIVLRHQRRESVGEFRRPRRTVFSQRDGAEADYNLTDQRLVERKSSSGKTGGCRRMRMHNSLNIRTKVVD